MSLVFFALLGPACSWFDGPGPGTLAEPHVGIGFMAAPLAPTDPLVVVRTDDRRPAEVGVDDATGAAVELAPVDYVGDPDPDPDPMRPWGWVPASGQWAPGEYTLTRVDGVESSEGFTVESFGVEPVPAEALVGRAWRVRSADAVSDLDELALSEGVPLLVIEGAAAGEVQFAELLDLADSGLCVSLRDVAAYDEGRARLEWAWPEATFGLGAENLPVEARDLWFEVWFSPDGSRAAARAHGEVDTRQLALEADLGEESGMCQLLATFGIECHECPDGEWLCRREDVDRIELLEEPAPDLAALPMCGVDRVSIEVPDVELGPIGCDGTFELDPDVSGDCGCAVGSATTRLAMPGLLALVAALRRRSDVLGRAREGRSSFARDHARIARERLIRARAVRWGRARGRRGSGGIRPLAQETLYRVEEVTRCSSPPSPCCCPPAIGPRSPVRTPPCRLRAARRRSRSRSSSPRSRLRIR